MINDNYIVSIDFGRPTGYVFNQTMVEKTLGKCSYIWDGASENRLNNGCSGLAGPADCTNPGSGYEDMCSEIKPAHTCTASDPEVKNYACKPFGPKDIPPSPSKGFQCFYGGPALNFSMEDDWNWLPDHLRDMTKARVNLSISGGDYKDHNEVILDERLLIPAIWNDPAVVIPAFVYAKSSGSMGRSKAEKMSEEFSRFYQVGRVPVLGMNDVTSFEPNGPFFVPEDDFEASESEVFA